MGHQNEPVDVESLQGSGRRRGRFLDVCLVMSVLLLMLAVTAVALGGLMVVMDFQRQLKDIRSKHVTEPESSKLIGTPSPTYQMENFAYLEATSGELSLNSTMRLKDISHGEGSSVGSNFIFNPDQHSLTPKKEGTFFMYIDLHLTSRCDSSNGLLRVQVEDKLTCEVELPLNSRSVTKKCWTVTRMEKKPLIAQITVPKEGLSCWKLELTGTGLGVFLVD